MLAMDGFRRGAVAMLMALAAGAALPAGEARAQSGDDPHCGSVVHYPGAVTVSGKAWGTADGGDFRSCTTTYRCERGAGAVEVFGYGYASDREGVIATENYAVAADGSEAVLGSCEAAGDRPALHQARACLDGPQRFQTGTAAAEQAQCTVVVGAPAGGVTIGSATCFCEG